MSQPLRAQFFVTRQNGSMVPLVAMDELPSSVNVRGVPRMLTSFDIIGMTAIGIHETRHRHHIVERLAAGFASQSELIADGIPTPSIFADEAPKVSVFARPGPPPSASSGFVNASNSPFPSAPKAFGIQEQAPGSTVVLPHLLPLRTDRKATVPVALPSWHDTTSLPLQAAPGVKEYCSYWLRHGECDYAQQGCLYRHEMPLDQTVLESLGLRDIPRWYREKHGLGSWLVGGAPHGSPAAGTAQHGSKKGAMGKNWWRDLPSQEKNDAGEGRGEKTEDVDIPDHETRTIPPVRSSQVQTKWAYDSSDMSKEPSSEQKPPKHLAKRTRFPSCQASVNKSHRAGAQNPSTSTPLSKFPTMAERHAATQARQMQQTLQALDAVEKHKQEHDTLADKHKSLQPDARFGSSNRDPPSPSSTVSSIAGFLTSTHVEKPEPPATGSSQAEQINDNRSMFGVRSENESDSSVNAEIGNNATPTTSTDSAEDLAHAHAVAPAAPPSASGGPTQGNANSAKNTLRPYRGCRGGQAKKQKGRHGKGAFKGGLDGAWDSEDEEECW